MPTEESEPELWPQLSWAERRATLWSAEKAVTAAYAVASVWEERVFFPQDSEKTDDMSSELVRVAIN